MSSGILIAVKSDVIEFHPLYLRAPKEVITAYSPGSNLDFCSQKPYLKFFWPMKLELFITELADYAELLPIALLIATGLYKNYRILFIGLIIHSALEFRTLYEANVHQSYNLDIYHVIGLVELIYVYLFFRSNIKINATISNLFYVVLILYIANSIFLEKFYVHLNPYGRALSFMYLITLCFNYYYRLYEEEKVEQLSKSSLFWISSAFLLYFSISFFTYLFSRQILTTDVEPTSFFGSMWTLHTLGDVLRCLIISFGLIQGARYEKTVSS